MRKNIVFLVIVMSFSCKENSLPLTSPEVMLRVDYELRDIQTGAEIVLLDQEVSNQIEYAVTRGDTLQLCRAYEDGKWHVESLMYDPADTDHCEHSKTVVVTSIKRIHFYTQK